MQQKRWFPAVLALALVSAVVPFTLLGQTGGGGGGQTGGGAGGAGGGRTTPSPSTPTTPTRPTVPSPTSPTDRTTMPDMTRPIYLSGRVVMDDGTAPPDPVVMMLVCSGRPRPQGYSDSKGRFSITLGQNQGMVADASVGSIGDSPTMGNPGSSGRGGTRDMMGGGRGITERDLAACELKADLAGFRSDIVNLSGRRVMDNPEVGTIVLHRLANVEGYTFSMTTANAPKDAKKAFEKGDGQLKKQKYEDAETSLRKAVETYPKYAVAWNDLGDALRAQKKDEEAEKAYAESIAADSKYLNPHLQMLQYAVNRRDWQQIAERSQNVIKLNPFNYPQVWFFNSAANYNLKHLDEAEKSAREALKLDPEHRNPRISQLLGAILIDKGDYPGALAQLRNYMSLAQNAPDIENVKRQIAELERVSGVKATAQAPETAPPEK